MTIPKKYKGYKFKVDNSHKYYGTTDTEKKTVVINVKKHKGDKQELKDTIAHEKKHIDNPQLSEKQVEKEHKSAPIDTIIKGLV